MINSLKFSNKSEIIIKNNESENSIIKAKFDDDSLKILGILYMKQLPAF